MDCGIISPKSETAAVDTMKAPQLGGLNRPSIISGRPSATATEARISDTRSQFVCFRTLSINSACFLEN